MKLSKRLDAIASLVSTNSIIDIGCDHAYLDIYLASKNIKCVGTDISGKVLKQALINVKNYKLENKIQLILSDGLSNVELKNEDTIIIAGMGTSTILEILKNYNKTNDIIISSNNELCKLRSNIVKKGYHIFDEKVIFEKNHCYVIIKFRTGIKKYTKIDYLLGPVSKKNKEYLKFLLNKNHEILQNIPKKYILKRIYLIRLSKTIEKLIKKIN